MLFSATSKAKSHCKEWELEQEAERGQTRKVRHTDEREEGAFVLGFSPKEVSSLNALPGSVLQPNPSTSRKTNA